MTSVTTRGASGVAARAVEQVHGLGEARSCRHQRAGRQGLRGAGASGVVGVVAIEQGYQRAGIGEGHGRTRCCLSARPSEKRRPQPSESGSAVPATAPM